MQRFRVLDCFEDNLSMAAICYNRTLTIRKGLRLLTETIFLYFRTPIGKKAYSTSLQETLGP